MIMSMPAVEDLARRLAGGLPEALSGMRAEIEAHLRAVLQQQASQLGLVSQEEFRVQARLLERTRARLEQLEAMVQGRSGSAASSGAGSGAAG
jgi:BMFP domain-containing protein YqiC